MTNRSLRTILTGKSLRIIGMQKKGRIEIRPFVGICETCFSIEAGVSYLRVNLRR